MAMVVVLAGIVTKARSGSTIEQFLSFTNRDQLHSYEGGNGNRLMWVETTQGIANIWFADQVDNSWTDAKPATNYSADDGMEIDIFGFFDKETIHYSRKDTDDANPLHLNGMLESC